MLLKDFVRAHKTVTGLGAWTDKRMTKNPSKFPLWRPKGTKLGSAWRWRVVEFSVLDVTSALRTGRMLVAYRLDKQEFLSYVGVDELTGNGTLVIACLEFHGTHAGWHLHAACASHDRGCVGRVRHAAMRRLPGGGRHHRQTTFVIDDDAALRRAAETFNFDELTSAPQPQGLLDFGS